MRCGYAFPLIGGHLVAAGIDSQPSARAGRRGRKVGLGWRFGQRGHGSLVSIPVPPPRKLVGCETAGEGGGWGTAAARGRATDRTPDLGSGRGRGGGGGKERRRETTDDRRQARQESGYNETRARWQPRVSVLNAVFAAAADQAVLRSLYPSVHRRVPVRGAKERVNVSLGFGVTRHSGGAALAWRGSEALGDWRTQRGALGGAVSLVGPFNASPLSKAGCRCRCFWGQPGEDEPGAAGSSGHGAFLRWFSVLLPLRHGPMVSRRGNSRSLALLPAVPFAHLLWRLERRGEASARARPLDPSYFFQLLSAKCCQDVHVRSQETPASWEAFVAASSMARGFPSTLTMQNGTHRHSESQQSQQPMAC